jgi:YVTN family beta-propeller protein
VPSNADGKLWVIDAVSEPVPSQTVVCTIEVGPNAFGVAVSPDGQRVYVTLGHGLGPGSLVVIDTATSTAIDSIPLGPGPLGVVVSPDSQRVYVGLNGQGTANTVAVVDAASNQVVGSFSVGRGPGGMAFSPDGSRLYVVNSPESSLSVIDLETWSSLAIIPLTASRGLSAIAVGPSGEIAYVAGPDGGIISFVDLVNFTQLGTLPVGIRPQGLALSRDGSRLYITNGCNPPGGPADCANVVTVLDTATHGILATIPVGDNPLGLSLNGDGSLLFVANYGVSPEDRTTGTVSVIDTSTNTVRETLRIGPSPVYAFGNFAYEPHITHVVRDLLPCYIAGAANQVKIAVTPPTGTLAHALEDQPPTGWTVSNISDGGSYDSGTGRVKWGPFFDANSRTLTYDVTPPAGITEAVNWTGLASFDGVNEEIGGDAAIAEPCGFPPDYNPGDLRITVGEVTGYGACWRGGNCTGIPVVPALIAYVTRAGFLWRSGEIFHRDPACAETYPNDAQCWLPGVGGPLRMLGGPAGPSRRVDGTATLLPLSARPNGRAFDVTIVLTPNRGTLAQAVEQRVPKGARVTRISDGGVYDARTRWVKWGPFLDDTPRTLTYRVALPVRGATSPRLAGRASFDGAVVRIR